MALVDLKFTPAEVKEEKRSYQVGEAPAYPWGTAIRLEKPEIEKLGLKIGTAKIGQAFKIEAVAVVTSVSMRMDENDMDSQSIAFQITEMAIEPSIPVEKEEAKKPSAGTKSLMTYYEGSDE